MNLQKHIEQKAEQHNHPTKGYSKYSFIEGFQAVLDLELPILFQRYIRLNNWKVDNNKPNVYFGGQGTTYMELTDEQLYSRFLETLEI